MHVVYHEINLPKVVDTNEYYLLLETDEWFDRPQQKLKGNTYETERLLCERRQRTESRPSRCSEYSGDILQDSDDGQSVYYQCSEDITGRRSESENNSKEAEVKKRGRPKKAT